MVHNRYLLGLDIDDFPLSSILQLVEGAAKEEGGAHYLAMVEDRTFGEINGWFSPQVRDRELMEALQGADWLLYRGSLVRRYAFLIEGALQEQLAGGELLNGIAGMAVERGLSLYLLGRHEGEVSAAAGALKSRFPGLELKGFAATQITISGSSLVEAPDRDALLLEQIHAANPSILCIDFPPTQAALWFSRVADQLHVPLAVGMGGECTVLCGSHNAPQRVCPREFFCLRAKLAAIGILAACYHRFSQAMYNLCYRHLSSHREALHTRLFVSLTRTIAVLELPTLLDLTSDTVHCAPVDEALAHDHLVVDFRHVKHITLAGIGFLTDLWLYAKRKEREISGLALSGDMRCLLKLHRAWDLIGTHQHHSNRSLIATLQQARHNALYESFEQSEGVLTAGFFGHLDNHQDYERPLIQLMQMVKEGPWILDMAYCATIEGRGCSFLLEFQRQLQQKGKELYVRGLSVELKRELERSKLLSNLS